MSNAWKSWTQQNNNTQMLVILMEQEMDPIFPPNLNYTKYEEIMLLHPKINVLTAETQSQISNMKKFHAKNGRINTVYLMAPFSYFNIYNCSTNAVFIKPTWTYQTEHLAIVHSNLIKLPKHLNVLKNLEILYLHHNQIEFIDMAEINGLDKIKRISLHFNKIIEIRATLHNPVYLPKLEELYASKNRLVDINFKRWNASSLRTIDLNENQLRIALSITNTFPALGFVDFHSNPLNCEWLTATLKELKARKNLRIAYESETKCNNNGPALDELTRQVLFKEMFATEPLLRHFQSELYDLMDRKQIQLDILNKTVSANIQQLLEENVALNKSCEKIEHKISKLLLETDEKLEKFQTEDKELESRLTEKLKKVENSHQLQLNLLQKSMHNVTDLHLLESNQSREESRKDLNKTVEHYEQQIARLEDDNKEFRKNTVAEIHQVLKLMNDLQHQLNASSTSTRGSFYGRYFNFDKYSVILLVVAVLFCLYLVKIIMNTVTKERQKTQVSEQLPLTSFGDENKQILEQPYNEKEVILD